MDNEKNTHNNFRQWLVSEADVVTAKKMLINSKHIFSNHLFEAEKALLAGDCEKVAQLAQTAGDFAFHHHPGMFSSPELERVLTCCAEKLDKFCTVTIGNMPEKVTGKKHILHVLSQGYASGGHTRLVARWIENDADSIHSVMTLLNGSTMPDWIVESAIRSGGRYFNLEQPDLTLCSKAKILRDIAYAWADTVILHIHPYDVVPTIAFGIDGGPPVVLLNHSDHTFWIGIAAADMIADIRPAGQDVTMKRRGTHHSMLLPIPMVDPVPTYTRESARAKLGIDDDTVVLLSIASPYKYTPCGNYNFLQTVYNLVQKHSNVFVLVIGPRDEGMWNQLRQQTNGRVRAIGLQQDLELFHCAADVYLDSFSMGSLTASLEAGLRGLPVVGLDSQFGKTLRINDISFLRDQDSLHADGVAYEQKIENLITDASLRDRLGSKLSRNIRYDHVDGWNTRLQDIYQALPIMHKVLPEYEKIGYYSEDDMMWAYLEYKNGLSFLYKDKV